jgi:hypothetical protein
MSGRSHIPLREQRKPLRIINVSSLQYLIPNGG